MKNPFEKRDHTALIASVAIGSIAAGAATWLFTTERGATVREQLAVQFEKLSNLFKSNSLEEVVENHVPQYAHKRAKTPKTDRDALLHNEILHEPEAGAATE